MKSGKEHRVALLPGQNLVLKVADARKLATESLFDCLIDLLLSNHFLTTRFNCSAACVSSIQAEGVESWPDQMA